SVVKWILKRNRRRRALNNNLFLARHSCAVTAMFSLITSYGAALVYSEYVDVEYHNDGKEDEDDEDMDKFSDVNRGDMSADPSTASNEEPRVVEDSKHYTSFSEEDIETSSSAPQRPNVTPLAFTKIEAYKTIISAVDHIAATNERPRILYDMPLTPLGRNMLREAAKQNMRLVLHEGQCRLPQPRFMPPFVQLHRCAPDSGCCVNENMNEDMVCAPIDGQYVKIPFNLHRCTPDSGCCVNENMNEDMVCAPIDGQYVKIPFNLHRCAPDSGCCVNENMNEDMVCAPIDGQYVKIPFNLHRCAPDSGCCVNENMNEDMVCAPIDGQYVKIPFNTLQATVTVKPSVMRHSAAGWEERQNDWRSPSPTQAPPAESPEEEDVTAPPQCTCPAFFLANITDSGSCTCACDWRDASHRRECQLFSRGREHLGLRDRVCIAAGKCAPPVCDFGAYEREVGKCPFRVRRIRYHVKRHQQEKNIV
ncbi:VEGF27Ca, partial [Operophtera brumata]